MPRQETSWSDKGASSGSGLNKSVELLDTPGIPVAEI